MSALYELSKPGIIYGNVMVAIAVYIFGSHWDVNAVRLLEMIFGLALIIASAATINNIIDRPIDVRMERTKNRVLVRGAISVNAAYIYATLTGILGVALLLLINLSTLLAGLAGWGIYVALYSPLKHVSRLAVFVGAFSGATPTLVGYAAATGMVDTTAWWLYTFLFLWQLPHFLAIAVYRYDEYAAAGVKLLVPRPRHELQRTVARVVFYSSLVVLLAFCIGLMLQR